MSVDQSIYMGPYIQAPLLEKISTITVKVCENNKNHRITTVSVAAKFCPECGGKIVDLEKVKRDSWSAWSELTSSKYEDTLAPAGEADDEILIARQKLKGGSEIYLDSDSWNAYELPTDEQKEKNMAIFKQQYAEPIAYLEKAGFIVSFHYGLIIYFM